MASVTTMEYGTRKSKDAFQLPAARAYSTMKAEGISFSDQVFPVFHQTTGSKADP